MPTEVTLSPSRPIARSAHNAVRGAVVILALGVFALSQQAYATVPESTRSSLAVARVEPQLRSDFKKEGLGWGEEIFVRVFKEEKELEIHVNAGNRFVLFRTYPICSYSGRLGPKLREGDRQAPEGFYYVTPKRMNPASQFHLSFDLGFPNAYDRTHGRTGSYLMVHGDCVSVGCYAMATRRLPIGRERNRPIEEIWTLIRAAFLGGQPFVRVHAFPFRMTEENMKRHAASQWSAFWRNLKEGYDFFEKSGRPPNTVVKVGRYAFEKDP